MSWPYAYTPYIWPMLASAGFMTALAFYGWKHRNAPGAISYGIISLSTAVWALFAAIEMAATVETAQIFWYKLEFMAIVAVVTGLPYFALAYAHPGQRTPRRRLQLLSALSL